jgi:hypothetical protein
MRFRRPGRTAATRTTRRSVRAVPSRAAFLIPGMVLAMALAGCAGRSAAGRGPGPGQAAGAPASPAPGLSTTHAARPTPAVTGPAVSPRVAAIVNGMTLPDKIGTDQEGGIVSRLAGVTTVFPGQMAAGATRDPTLIRAQDQATGAAMRALGINLDYAPAADVNTDPANPVIGIRSFGAHPTLVSTMTTAAVDGFHQAGEVTVAATSQPLNYGRGQ